MLTPSYLSKTTSEGAAPRQTTQLLPELRAATTRPALLAIQPRSLIKPPFTEPSLPSPQTKPPADGR